MKLLVSIVPLLFSSLVTCASGFATPYAAGRAASCRSAYQLVAEVEGGDELLAKSSLPGSRMKNLGEVKGMTSKDGQVCKFWMTAVGEGALIKEYRARILKDASKKANFPGFRKGQVPPYAQPQITTFAIQEALIKSVESAVAAYGLKALPGSDGEVQILEDVQEMCKGYQVGDNLPFTATLKCAFGSAQSASSVTVPVVESFVDAQVESVES